MYDHARVIRVLRDANARLGLKLTPPRIESLDMAVMLGDFNAVKSLVKAGEWLTGFTLRYCVGFDEVEMLKYFDDIEYIGNIKTGSHQELMVRAVEAGAYHCLDYLLGKGMDPNFSIEPFEASPLRAAVTRQNVPMFKYLLDHGADIHMPVLRGANVLHLAAAKITWSSQNLSSLKASESTSRTMPVRHPCFMRR